MLIPLLLTTAAAASAATSATGASTLQDRFNAATADAAAGKCAAAVASFQQLEKLPSVQRNAAVLATMRVREGKCLVRLSRIDEGQSALAAGLAALPADVSNYHGDRIDAMIELGAIEYRRLNYAAALPHFHAAAAAATTDDERIITDLWLTRTTMFDVGDEAETHAGEMLRLVVADPELNKRGLAEYRTLHARVLLNQGKNVEALAELRKSSDAQGGLTTKVNIAQVITRSDLAIAALLKGDKDAAREYLAYTGAGHLDVPFASARDIDLPACGGASDIRPSDSVIVEFSIAQNGSVNGAQPIWTSRKGPMALEFARSVTNWSWTPDEAAKIPPFFRALTRVELRCTNTVSRPSIVAGLDNAANRWLAEKGYESISMDEGESAARAYPEQLARLKVAEAQGDTLALIGPLLAVVNNVTNVGDNSALLNRALRIVVAAGAPTTVRASFEIRAAAPAPMRSGSNNADIYRRRLRALLADSVLSSDAQVAATLKLLIAQPSYRGAPPSDAVALLTSVVEDHRLPDKDPLRVAALLRLADINKGNGNLTAAAASFAKTGLNADQCALVAPVPEVARQGSTSFPQEAQRWGFEGWVRFETDVLADGKTTNQRAVIAYPPFIFRDAAVTLASNVRFKPSYRPEGAIGCTGYQNNIAFHIQK